MLNDSNNEESKFSTKKWHVIDTETIKDYNKLTPIKFDKENIKLNICDYSDAYVLVARNITVNARNYTYVLFKNHATFSVYKAAFNDIFTDGVDHFYIGIRMYNSIEFKDNHWDTPVSLLQC